MSDAEPRVPEVLEGLQAFGDKALEMIGQAKSEVVILSQQLDGRVYGTEDFSSTLSRFILQHPRTRVRVLVAYPQQAVGNAIRFIELGRRLTTFIEFRALSEERRALVGEEYIISDGRILLFRETSSDLESRYHGNQPHEARQKLRNFDTLWNESSVAQELRNLKI